MKKLAVGFATVVVSAALFAGNTYYVDAKNGNDLWDGSCAEHVDGTTQGPRETLAGIMELATSSGDVVYALPGVYSNKTMTASGLNRVVIKSYVTLLSTEGPEKTIIMGEADPDFPLYDGCGTNSVRGVYVRNYARLSGFTITGGHAQYKTTASYEQGGGVMADSCSLTPSKIGVIDNCIISNNVAYQSGGCRFGGYVGCRIVDNKSPKQNYSCITATREGFLYDCYLRGAGWAADFSYAYNTTFDCTIHGKWGSNMCKNCVILGDILNYMGSEANPGCSNCVIVSSLKSGHQKYSDAATRFLTRAEMMVDADGRPQKGSPLINTAVEAYHDTAPFPSALGGVSAIDALGLSRISGGTMDVGGYEYDWRGDFAEALDPLGDVDVTNASSRVSLKDATTVFLPTNTTLALTWKPRVGTSANYRFRARVTGTGTLTILKDGEAWQTLTAADGERWYSTIKEGVLGLDFSYAAGADDDGGVEIWDFTNISYANITVTDGGVTLEGATAGLNYVPAGGTLTFTATRAFDRADLICTGVTSNGVFYAFDDYPNGLTFVVSDELRANLVLTAVYDATVTGTWYVDAVNGKDSGNYGHHRLNAFKTLSEAMSHVKKDEVVYALPGVYSNGTMTTTETLGGASVPVLNRVVVPAGVQLISTEGPEKTIILGAADPDFPLFDGCGTNSVRCVAMKSNSAELGSRLVGFTVTGGRACYRSASAAAEGGGFMNEGRNGADMNMSCVEQCIISNNVAYTYGAGIRGAYIGCRIVDNRANTYPGVNGWNELYLCDCFAAGNTANSYSYQIDRPRYAYNTTVVGSTGLATGYNDNRNCVFLGYITMWGGGTGFYHRNCVFRSGDGNDAHCTWNDNDARVLTAAEINLDADGYPLAGSKLIDGGTNGYHVLPDMTYPTKTRKAGDYWPGTHLQKDACGAQRTYNGTIDIGCNEYDWRGVYAADMGRYVTVSNATSGVVEDDGKVCLTDGEVLTAVLRGKAGTPYRLEFAITGAGTLTVKRGETVVATLTAGASAWEFKLASDSDVLTFSYDGDGAADLGKVKSNYGLMLIVR